MASFSLTLPLKRSVCTFGERNSVKSVNCFTATNAQKSSVVVTSSVKQEICFSIGFYFMSDIVNIMEMKY